MLYDRIAEIIPMFESKRADAIRIASLIVIRSLDEARTLDEQEKVQWFELHAEAKTIRDHIDLLRQHVVMLREDGDA